MKITVKKILSLLLAVVIIFGAVPASIISAETEPTVKLVSFMRGDVTDLRSSELLEVQVDGYDGNPRELSYKWTSSLGTYLYVYNSHNMYGINNTDGEREIYNSAKKISNKNMTGSQSMAGRTYDKTFEEVGFAWAAVYGADLSDGQLNGTVKVEVFDNNDKLIGWDEYSNFKNFNLDKDLDNVVIGIFEGDSMDVRDLLGQSGVVHITCSASKVSSATVKSGGEYIAIERVEIDRNTYNYYVKGVKAGTNEETGDAKIDIKIAKEYCKFHAYSNGTAQPIVYVFKKPKTTTTTTTLTLVSDIDSRCEYFINGNKGEKQSDGTIIFTGLDPNTEYTVEVRAEYKDGDETKYAYGYVKDTTKPVYKATVKTLLDGELTDISAIHGEDVELYLHEDKEGAEYIGLTRENVGVYSAAVVNGIYYPWHIEAGNHYHQAREYKLIIENANGELELNHYSVKYYEDEEASKADKVFEKANYSSMAEVKATNNIPQRDGYVFAGWEYEGSTYNAGQQITSSISAPMKLVAKWEKMVNATINVIIDHRSKDGGYDHDSDRADLDMAFLEMTANSPAFVETGKELHFAEDKVIDENDNEKAYTYALENEHISKYTANGYTYTGLLESSAFGVAVSKSGYDVGTITKTQDKDGNWTITVPLTYTPSNFDIEFSVRMEKDVPKELYPDAVIVKVAYWNAELKEWKIISQQETTDSVTKPGVRVDIDPETGEGAGSYPVWKFDTDKNAYGYRAVVTGFIYDNSTVIVPTEKEHTKDDTTVVITYTDGNYTATMGDIADGKKFSTSLNGAYYNEGKQQGTLDGVITVEKYDVTFDAQGGTVNGKATDIAKDQYYVPSFKDYEPTMENHKFLDWFLDKDCTIPATEGELLVEDITLYAKWDRILTGKVIVDGYYTDEENNQYIVPSADRATQALVELKEITSDGEYNIAGQIVDIVWTAGEHYSEEVYYEFKELDPDKTYRVSVYLVNYEAAYQNSTTIINGNGDIHDDYNETDYKAVYKENELKTFVNMFLHFEPEEYIQQVEVDATRIGEGFRPSGALVKYYSEEIDVNDDYVLIIQHEGENAGVQVAMNSNGVNDGKGPYEGAYGDNVWKKNFNGNLYNYQAELATLTKNGNSSKVSQWPVTVIYGSPARWSPYNQASTGALEVILVPNRYNINYHEYYLDEQTEVVSYSAHIWSYDTEITYEPVREGYVFAGWYDKDGNKVSKINASVASDTDLYAKWNARTDLELTVNYVVKGTDKVLETETKTAQVFGNVVTAQSLAKDIKGYTYDSASAESITIGTINENNVINLYYIANTYGYVVNYIDEANDKVLYTKEETAVYGETITENAITIKNYLLVDDATKSIVIDTENNIINFYYAVDKIDDKDNNGEDGDGIPDKYQKKVEYEVVNGAWADDTIANLVEYVTLIKDGKYDENGSAEIFTPEGMIPFDGYEKGEWLVTPPSSVSGTAPVKYTFVFKVVETPEVPGGDAETPETPEGGADAGASGSVKNYIVFGKTDGIGWYNVSKDGGQTYEVVFGNSTYEVEKGTQLIIKVGDLMGDAFTFYVNGDAIEPDENGNLVVTVDGYMLIGALGYKIDVPDVEESLNWFQRIIKAIKDFFAKLFGKK